MRRCCCVVLLAGCRLAVGAGCWLQAAAAAAAAAAACRIGLVLHRYKLFTPSSNLMHAEAGGKFTPQACYNHTPAISSRHSILDTFYQCLSYTTDALVYAQSL